MQGQPRSPVELVRRLIRPAPVRLGGRVASCAPGCVLVQDSTGGVWVESRSLPPLGAWVLVDGTWDGERVVDAQIETLNEPGGAFPRPSGDWLRLQEDGARVARHLQDRATIIRGIRSFFDERAFLEVETPLAVPSPGLDVHLDAFEVRGGAAPRWLITSPEYQMKRLLAGGMQRIYQVCKCFRRGEAGEWHQPEFTMLEWYRAFADSDTTMRETEELVANLAARHTGSHRLPGFEGPIDVSPPWERLTVAEAFERHASAPLGPLLEDEEQFFRVLAEEVQPRLGRERPVFVIAWPAAMASLARLDPADPRVADRFEAYVDGIELCNGFGELIDPHEQRSRLEADQQRREVLGKPIYPVDEGFLAALEEGLPPCSGNALGVDRLVMLLLGLRDIREVISFPQEHL